MDTATLPRQLALRVPRLTRDRQPKSAAQLLPRVTAHELHARASAAPNDGRQCASGGTADAPRATPEPVPGRIMRQREHLGDARHPGSAQVKTLGTRLGVGCSLLVQRGAISRARGARHSTRGRVLAPSSARSYQQVREVAIANSSGEAAASSLFCSRSRSSTRGRIGKRSRNWRTTGARPRMGQDLLLFPRGHQARDLVAGVRKRRCAAHARFPNRGSFAPTKRRDQANTRFWPQAKRKRSTMLRCPRPALRRSARRALPADFVSTAVG